MTTNGGKFMSRENPRRRDHSTSKGGGNFHRRGDGLNTGPVGSNDFGSNSGSGSRDIGGGSGSLLSGGMMKIILIVFSNGIWWKWIWYLLYVR